MCNDIQCWGSRPPSYSAAVHPCAVAEHAAAAYAQRGIPVPIRPLLCSLRSSRRRLDSCVLLATCDQHAAHGTILCDRDSRHTFYQPPRGHGDMRPHPVCEYVNRLSGRTRQTRTRVQDARIERKHAESSEEEQTKTGVD